MVDQKDQAVSETLLALSSRPAESPASSDSGGSSADGSVGESLSAICVDDATLAALLEGNVSPRDRASVLRHLEECSTCQDLAVVALQALGSSTTVTPALLGVNFRPGSIVGGRYRIDRFIARGGMGEVYEAFDHELAERVALKTVRSTFSDDAHAQQRLKAEVQLARRISHPNICRIYDLGRHELGGDAEWVHFLSMEFIEGESLGQRLRRAPLSVEDARCIARQLLRGLEAAHAAGVLHRDFKSDNVMLRADTGTTLKAVITDFGLARALGAGDALRQSDHQRLVGSVAYMAPEQVAGARLGPPADIYAFGVVLFEMLTRQLPFSGDSPLAVALRRLNEPPPLPSKIRPELGTSWDEFVLRCLRRDCSQRYTSIEAAFADFERVGAQPGPPAGPRRAARGLGVLVVVLLCVVALRGALQPRHVEAVRDASRPAPAPSKAVPAQTAEERPTVPPAPEQSSSATPQTPDSTGTLTPSPSPGADEQARPVAAPTRRPGSISRRNARAAAEHAVSSTAKKSTPNDPAEVHRASASTVITDERELKLDREDPWDEH